MYLNLFILTSQVYFKLVMGIFLFFSVFVSYYNVEKDIKDIQKKKILNIFKNLSLFHQIFIFSQFELELEIQE